MASGTVLGFRDGAASPAAYSVDPATWICLLQGVSGNPMKLQIGRKVFRLSSDTIYFLEDLGNETPCRVGDPGGKASSRTEPFVYICGSREGLAKTLGDFQKVSRGETILIERTSVLKPFGN